ncbi:MAG: hypothetical protein WDM90_02770 [Ferruginibacter sp.]
MSDENIGGFFNYHDMEDDDDDEKAESWKPIKTHGNALYRKSIDILNLARTICDMLPEDEDEIISTKSLIMQNAYLIPAKIKGAMGMEYYLLMIENAVIIKVNACQLREQLWACNHLHGIERKYTDVLRNEIEEFRKIFISWVTSFDKENDLPDEWHLFNDPSTFPEDDEPFDAKDFFENFNPDDEE